MKVERQEDRTEKRMDGRVIEGKKRKKKGRESEEQVGQKARKHKGRKAGT